MLVNKEFLIEKLLGMNSSSPYNLYGTPTVLKNAVFNKVGGVSTDLKFNLADADDLKLLLATHPEVSLVDYDHDSEMVTTTTTPPYQRIRVTNFYTSSPTVGVYSMATPSITRLVNYGKEFVVGLPNDSTGNEKHLMFLVNQNGDYTQFSPLSENPGGIDLDFIDTGNEVGALADYNTDFYTSSGQLVGFDANDSHWIFVYLQEFEEGDAARSSGTTLNPEGKYPFRMRPYAFFLDARPQDPLGNQIHGEYYVQLRLFPGVDIDREVYVYGAAYPALRRLTEEGYVRNAGNLPPGASPVTVGTMVLKRVNRDTVAGPRTSWEVFTCTVAGTLPADHNEIDWDSTSGIFGQAVVAGTAIFQRVGYDSTATGLNSGPLMDYILDVANPPTDYVKPEDVERQYYVREAEWAKLYVERDGDKLKIYRSKDENWRNVEGFKPYTFFPCGRVTETHKNRSWVVGEHVLRGRVNSALRSNGGTWDDKATLITEARDFGQPKKTLYYSELNKPWMFPENFMILPVDDDAGVVMMRSLGEYLVCLTRRNAIVISGDSPANFRITRLDLPGAFNQLCSVVVDGTLYYLTWDGKGIASFSGGQVEMLGTEIYEELDRLLDVTNPDLTEASEPTMGADHNRKMLYLYINDDAGTIFVYHILSKMWTKIDAPETELDTFMGLNTKMDFPVGIGNKPGDVNISSFYTIRSEKRQDQKHFHDSMQIVYDDIDCGDMTVRKQFHGLRFSLRTTDSVLTNPPTVTVTAESESGTVTTDALTITKQFDTYRFTFRGISGNKLKLTINIDTVGSNLQSREILVYPPLRIEYSQMEERNYGKGN